MGSQQPRKSVCLGMPGNGMLTAGASRGLWRSSRGDKVDVIDVRKAILEPNIKYTDSSLLTVNFNALWCWALNRAHQGQPVDYFAMLHTDVEPEDFWLDTLVEELEARELDVLGTVVPIKDTNGLTSLALHNPAGDNWRPLCRLSMHEVYRLPETFTSADLGYPLLLNTGCWVAKFNMDWARQVFFTINDRIVFNTKANAYIAEVEPEDWFFSRLLHELGLKIGATRKVGLDHVGNMRFTNRQPWGQLEFDHQYVSASVIPQNGPAPVQSTNGHPHYYHEVPGYFDFEHVYRDAVAAIPDGGAFAEVGCWRGQSLSFLLTEAANSGKQFRVVGVDHFAGSVEDTKLADIASRVDVEAECKANASRSGYPFEIINEKSWQAASRFPDGAFDYVFIDASHDKASVVADLKAWSPKVKQGGTIAGHDLNQFRVKQALKEVFPDRIPLELPRPAELGGVQWGVCWSLRK